MMLSRKLLSSALIFALTGSSFGFALAAPAPKKKPKAPPAAVAEPGSPVADKKKDPKKDEKGAKKDEERKGPASFNANNARPGTLTPEDAAREVAADKKRDEEIEQLKQVIKQIPPDSGKKADLIFQLAELYYEKSKYLYSKEMRSY